MLHRELLIEGTFLGGVCDQGTSKEVVRDPWSGSVVGTYAESGPEEVEFAVVAAARAMQHPFPLSERKALLHRIAERIEEDREFLAGLLTREIGKPITYSLAEVQRCALTFRLAAESEAAVPRLETLDYDPRGKGLRAEIHRLPRGPVLAFTPYNWPLNLAAHKIAPALLAGCPVVLKGSPQAGLSTLSLARLIHECGCPPGFLNTVQCDLRLSEALARDPRFAVVSFTGSPRVGWKIRSETPTPHVILELGGNAFALVGPGADHGAAVEKLGLSAYAYAGQVCISTQHILVHRSEFEAFRDTFVARWEDLEAENPADSSTVCGPLIHEAQAKAVSAMVESACGQGAKLLFGGTLSGNRYSPTALDIQDFGQAQSLEMALATEEVFGPVVTLSPIDSIEEGATLVNQSKYAIHTSVFADPDSWDQASGLLRSPGLLWNEPPTLRFDGLPYGGERQSGFGREGLSYAFESMTYPQSRILPQER